MGRKNRRLVVQGRRKKPAKPKPGQKSKADDSHIRRRLSERYGISVSADDLETTVADIRSGRSHVLSNFPGQTRSRHAHLVWIKGVQAVVIYSKEREGSAALITAIPPNSTQIPWKIREQLQRKEDK